MIVVAVDPGDHMGWCVGTTEGEPYDAGTDTPAEFFARLERWVGTYATRLELPPVEGVNYVAWQYLPRSIDLVVIESYQVDDPAANQGSDVPTLQYIGVIKYICARAGVPFDMQSRQVKTAARSKLSHLERKPLSGTSGSLPDGGHAKDAQLHWWAWVWRH